MSAYMGTMMRRRWCGIVALLFGVTGTVLTVYASEVIKPPPPFPIPANAPETPHKTTGYGFSLSFGYKGGTTQPIEHSDKIGARSRHLSRAAVGCGCAAFAFAALSWIRRERPWLGIAACGFGVAAIAWTTVVIVFIGILLAGGPALLWGMSKSRDKTADA